MMRICLTMFRYNDVSGLRRLFGMMDDRYVEEWAVEKERKTKQGPATSLTGTTRPKLLLPHPRFSSTGTIHISLKETNLEYLLPKVA